MSDKIVIIDDEAEISRLLKIKLEHEGYFVSLAKDGETGLELVRKVLPNLILLDVVMPGKDGYAVLKELKEKAMTRDIPVIMLTAQAFDEDIQRGLDLKADDYIFKPFHSELILRRIEIILGRR